MTDPFKNLAFGPRVFDLFLQADLLLFENLHCVEFASVLFLNQHYCPIRSRAYYLYGWEAVLRDLRFLRLLVVVVILCSRYLIDQTLKLLVLFLFMSGSCVVLLLLQRIVTNGCERKPGLLYNRLLSSFWLQKNGSATCTSHWCHVSARDAASFQWIWFRVFSFALLYGFCVKHHRDPQTFFCAATSGLAVWRLIILILLCRRGAASLVTHLPSHRVVIWFMLRLSW